MNTHAFSLTSQAVHRHLAAMPCSGYELRLIHSGHHRCTATRYWSASQLCSPQVLAFLRARNRDGCDVYFRPYAPNANAGYLLLDFDQGPCPLAAMRAAGHAPCLVVQTSPGHHQAWVRASAGIVPPESATAAARSLAWRYGADPASAGWRHLGRLAGFTNQKPARRQSNGWPPWVRILFSGDSEVRNIDAALTVAPGRISAPFALRGPTGTAVTCYQSCLHRLGLLARFPNPDWSVVDYRVARLLLSEGSDAAEAATVLRQGSPEFPRSHSDSEQYLRRTVDRAAASLAAGVSFFRAPVQDRHR